MGSVMTLRRSPPDAVGAFSTAIESAPDAIGAG
jgi:hypothetical protein